MTPVVWEEETASLCSSGFWRCEPENKTLICLQQFPNILTTGERFDKVPLFNHEDEEKHVFCQFVN